MMTKDAFKLICIHDLESGTYCVWAKSMPGLVVQVENLEDAPREMAKSYECILKYGFKENLHEIVEFQHP